ncbi:MAG: DUF4386 domain-containing protein [Gemmatimonadota bacterium]|nr:DUF4386 domain-containing protein [Gemmatimonadota bacterium]
MSFAGYLVEAVCDIVPAWIFYLLLRPVRRDLALISAFFGLVSTATFAIVELFYFAAPFILGGADYLKTFSPDQLNSLAMLSLKFFGVGGGLFMVFYGVGWAIRGYLIVRSDYLPRVLGALLALGGLGFITRNFALGPGAGVRSRCTSFPYVSRRSVIDRMVAREGRRRSEVGSESSGHPGIHLAEYGA